MYIATLTYKVNDETKTLTHNVEECYMHVAEHGHSCNFVLPTDALQGEYEALISEQNEIVNFVLADADANELYNSIYWNRVASINNSFPADGTPRCDVQFSHYVPTNADTNVE